MNQLARQTRQIIDTVAGIQIDPNPATKTDRRNKGISTANFARFVNASNKALKNNIDANRAAYDKNNNTWSADKRSEVMAATLTAIAILKSRAIDYDGLTGQPVNPATCKHADHDCNGQCYTCGGYFAAGDVSGFMS